MGFEVSDGIDLDRAAMTGLIADFLRAAATANTAVLFYAGHGVQIDGENFLLPIDVKFNGVGDLTSEMMNVSTILAGLDDRHPRQHRLSRCLPRQSDCTRRSFGRQTRSRAVRSAYRPCLSPSSLSKGANHGGGHSASLRHGPAARSLLMEMAQTSPFSPGLARHLGTLRPRSSTDADPRARRSESRRPTASRCPGRTRRCLAKCI